MSDIEVVTPRDGYPALAEWISRDPDYETLIFRRFDRLAARNLLNMQSELLVMEAKLDKMDEASRQDRYPGLRRWETFEHDIEQDDRADHNNAIIRRDLFNKLEKKMEDYR